MPIRRRFIHTSQRMPLNMCASRRSSRISNISNRLRKMSILVIMTLFLLCRDTFTSSKVSCFAAATGAAAAEDVDGDAESKSEKEETETLEDAINDSFYHNPASPDPSCTSTSKSKVEAEECWDLPESTIETERVVIDAAKGIYGGEDPSEEIRDISDKEDGVGKKSKIKLVDKHWGTDETILKMRNKLRDMGRGTTENPHENKRPPIFLMPGLASTRLVSWKHKACSNPLLKDVKVQDYVWMNINILLQMATLDESCFLECMTLGLNQTDTNDPKIGCKLRPDEGLDAISSLAPDSLGSNMLVGGKNTVYAWLTQWLSDNLGYDVTSIIGLPYDWRLSPDVMEKRDGFLTLTRKRIEAAVKLNGEPGIMVAHSMGNNVFRFFLEWLKNEMHEEAYARLVKQAESREMSMRAKNAALNAGTGPGWIYSQTISENTEIPSVQYSVTDQMYSLANSFVDSLDEMWQSYTNGEEQDPTDTNGASASKKEDSNTVRREHHSQLWELAQAEGDDAWLEWINNHIWTYIGLSAPLLGAINPLRAVLSGENMGLPMTEKSAREMELSFGSTHTLNPISTSTGFCDDIDDTVSTKSNLACLDELIEGIDRSKSRDPWRNYPALKALLKDRVDWDTDFEPISVIYEECDSAEKPPCHTKEKETFSPKDVQSGEIFNRFSAIWKEEGNPLITKREQLETSWWEHAFPNLLNSTWDRPHIKHVIMSYGVDHSTEVGYVYKKTNIVNDGKHATDDHENFDDIPFMTSVVWEEKNNYHFEESKVAEQKTLKESVLLKKKPKRRPLNGDDNKGALNHSGDASVPYISLSWAHTWLLHATRAMRHSRDFGMKEGERISDHDDNPLDSIRVSYRPAGGKEWIEGGKPHDIDEIFSEKEDPDTGADHPHGTKYKPEMLRYQSKGKSRSTGMEYTTAVIEAVGVEHKETTRNYDILAAVFTDVLKNMHDDFGLV